MVSNATSSSTCFLPWSCGDDEEMSTTTLVRLVLAGVCIAVLVVASVLILCRMMSRRPVTAQQPEAEPIASGTTGQMSEVAQSVHSATRKRLPAASRGLVEDSIVSGARPAASVDPHGVARVLFDHHDADGNGMLDAEELWSLITQMGHKLTLPDVRAAIAKLDSDGNGMLHFEEFLRWFDLGLTIDALFDKEKLAEHKALRMRSIQKMAKMANATMPEESVIKETFDLMGVDTNGSGVVTHLDARHLTRAMRRIGFAMPSGMPDHVLEAADIEIPDDPSGRETVGAALDGFLGNLKDGSGSCSRRELNEPPPTMVTFEQFHQVVVAIYIEAAAELSGIGADLTSVDHDMVRQEMATEFKSTASTQMAGTDRSHISHESGAVKERPGKATYHRGSKDKASFEALGIVSEAPDAESQAVDASGDDGAGMPHAQALPMKHAVTTAQPHEIYSV